MEEKLRYYTRIGDKCKVKQLLTIEDIDVNQFDSENIENPLLLACWKGDIEIIHLLLADERIDVNILNKYGQGPTHYACFENLSDVIKLLLEDGRINIQLKSEKNGLTLFECCCLYSRIEIINLLIEMKGNELTEYEINLGKFVDLCLGNISEESEGMYTMLRRKLNINEMLIIACSSGNIKMVKTILASNDPLLSTNFSIWYGITPLIIACHEGHANIVSLLCGIKNVEVNKPMHDGETPLFVACKKGRVDVVKFLLEDSRVKVNDVNIMMEDGRTPFYIACQQNHVEVVKLLLRDERVEINLINNQHETPFYVTCKKGSIEIVKLFLNDQRVDMNKRDENGATPFYIACWKGYIEIVKLLLKDERIDINKPRTNGATPFYIACEKGYIEIVKLILASERGIDLGQKWNNKKTALDVSIERSTSTQKNNWETEEAFKYTKKNCSLIVELIGLLQKNPQKIQSQLRKEVNYCIFLSFFLFLFSCTNSNY